MPLVRTADSNSNSESSPSVVEAHTVESEVDPSTDGDTNDVIGLVELWPATPEEQVSKINTTIESVNES